MKANGSSVAYDTNGSWRPKILRSINFGDKGNMPNERSLKSEKELWKFSEPPKIVAVRYMTCSEGGLQGLQLVYEHGFKTTFAKTHLADE